jgi:hypothetical protein
LRNKNKIVEKGMEEIPKDVLLLIFFLVDDGDLLNITRVCHQWRKLILVTISLLMMLFILFQILQ